MNRASCIVLSGTAAATDQVYESTVNFIARTVSLYNVHPILQIVVNLSIFEKCIPTIIMHRIIAFRIFVFFKVKTEEILIILCLNAPRG